LMLLGFSVLFTRTGGVINHLMEKGFRQPFIQGFFLKAALTEILPIYVGTAFLLSLVGLMLAKSPLFLAGDWERWSLRHGFWISLGFGLATHIWLWWEVPTTLWVLPGINLLPLGLGLFLTALMTGVCFWKGLAFSRTPLWRKALTLGIWAACAWTSLLAPKHLAKAGLESGPVNHPARVVMLSIDGLRLDTAYQAGLQDFRGFQVRNGFTAIPATRVMWSILWGGDPGHYSVGNLLPAKEEFEGTYPFTLLETAKAQGLKARFYIDDGGTIALADRNQAFDQALTPARGWENFLNSNAAVHFPLFAVWLDALRVFPSTTPWTPADLGLKTALNLGRGSDWVMYHSCLAHQPIFLTRKELGFIPQWWALPARRMTPHWAYPNPKDIASWRPEYGPFLAYQIRIRSVLAAWQKIWDTLPGDQDYGQALRIMFTDHGERFYHWMEEPDIQMGGSHGYNLDPWEARIPMVFDGPGIQPGQDTNHALSLLEVRDAVAQRLLHQEPLNIQAMLAKDYAPLRMHAIGRDMFKAEEVEYRELSTEEIGRSAAVLPDGVWLVKYESNEETREKDLTVAEARGQILRVWRPMKKGGARRVDYRGYQMTGYEDVDEAHFQEARARIFKAFKKPWSDEPQAHKN
ncbi:MAG TPA: hypothetical protein VGJ89_10660, partial [Geothrix sp.]